MTMAAKQHTYDYTCKDVVSVAAYKAAIATRYAWRPEAYEYAHLSAKKLHGVLSRLDCGRADMVEAQHEIVRAQCPDVIMGSTESEMQAYAPILALRKDVSVAIAIRASQIVHGLYTQSNPSVEQATFIALYERFEATLNR